MSIITNQALPRLSTVIFASVVVVSVVSAVKTGRAEVMDREQTKIHIKQRICE
jgi:hypothetical protein